MHQISSRKAHTWSSVYIIHCEDRPIAFHFSMVLALKMTIYVGW